MRWLKSVLHIDNFLSILILLVFYGLFFRSCNNNFTDPIADAFADVELTDIVYAQFNMNDKYSQVTNGELTTPDTNIVIVNIGNLNREGIAKQIHILNKYINENKESKKYKTGLNVLKNSIPFKLIAIAFRNQII